MMSKARLLEVLGSSQSASLYFECIRRFLLKGLCKAEFDSFVIYLLGSDNVELHNEFISNILKNAQSKPVQVVSPQFQGEEFMEAGSFPRLQQLDEVDSDAVSVSGQDNVDSGNRDLPRQQQEPEDTVIVRPTCIGKSHNPDFIQVLFGLCKRRIGKTYQQQISQLQRLLILERSRNGGVDGKSFSSHHYLVPNVISSGLQRRKKLLHLHLDAGLTLSREERIRMRAVLLSQQHGKLRMASRRPGESDLFDCNYLTKSHEIMYTKQLHPLLKPFATTQCVVERALLSGQDLKRRMSVLSLEYGITEGVSDDSVHVLYLALECHLKNILCKLLGHVRGDFSGKSASLRERAKASWIQNHLPKGSSLSSLASGNSSGSSSISTSRGLGGTNSKNTSKSVSPVKISIPSWISSSSSSAPYHHFHHKKSLFSPFDRHQETTNHNLTHEATKKKLPLINLDDLLFSWGLCPSILVEDQMTREQALFLKSL